MSAGLLAAIRVAEAQVSAAEAVGLVMEARIKLAEAALATARRVASAHGVGVSDANSAAPVVGPSTAANLSEAEFARFMGVSERTIANDRTEMAEGVHYHRHGRRVLYHVPEAADFIRHRRQPGRRETAQTAVDEVTQRRARTALRGLRSGR